MKRPTTSATTLRLFMEALSDLGVDCESILRRCGIAPQLLESPEARIPSDHLARVWVAAQEVTEDPCIGLHAGERVRPHAVNLFGYLMLSSATIGDGLRRVARYQRVLTGIPWIEVEEDPQSVHVIVGMQLEDAEARAMHAEYVALLILDFLSWVSEAKVVPVKAQFQHEARGDPAEYRRALGCPVSFGAGRSEVTLSAETLARPSLHANPPMAILHEEFAEKLFSRLDDGTTASRVQRVMAEQLESGAQPMPDVARRLGMSTRGLQRRLADEGTAFRALLEELRGDLAREHLEKRDTPIAEIAYLTGFSDVSAFTRAVRRWFGRTPADHRRWIRERT